MNTDQPRRKTDWVFLSPFILFFGFPLLGWITQWNQEGQCGFGSSDLADPSKRGAWIQHARAEAVEEAEPF